MLKSVFLIVPLFTFSVSSTVQAQSMPNLSIQDRQHFSRDLTPSYSQDFFAQGRNQLEQEIRRVETRSPTQSASPLQIDPALLKPAVKQSLRKDLSPRSQPSMTSTRTYAP